MVVHRTQRGACRCAQAGDLQQPRRPASACRPGRAAPAPGLRHAGGACPQLCAGRPDGPVRCRRIGTWPAWRRGRDLRDAAPAPRSRAAGRAGRLPVGGADISRAGRRAGPGRGGGPGLDDAGRQPRWRLRQRHRRHCGQGRAPAGPLGGSAGDSAGRGGPASAALASRRDGAWVNALRLGPWRMREVPGALVLRLHIARIERIDGRQQRDPVHDIQASTPQEVDLVRVVGQQPDARDAQLFQHRHRRAEVTLVRAEA